MIAKHTTVLRCGAKQGGSLAQVMALFLVFCLASIDAPSAQAEPGNPKMKAAIKAPSNWIIEKTTKEGSPIYRLTGQIVVKYKSATVTPEGLSLPKGLIRKLRKTGGELRVADTFTFDESVSTFADMRAKLQLLPSIALAEPNILFKPHAADLSKKQWHLESLEKGRTPVREAKRLVDKVPNGNKPSSSSKGQKSSLCVMDTGVDYSHPDLQGNIIPGVNIIDETADEMDDHGHGTMVAGVIAAVDNDFGVTGVNPNVNVCGIKVLNRAGVGSLGDVIEGVNWATKQKIPLLNMSFGSYEYSEILQGAINDYTQGGGIVVASAGNDRVQGSMYPARYENVYSVGSHDRGGWISSFSNWGDSVDIFVPGSDLLTTGLSSNENLAYANFSGTSSAAAFASGLVSLILNNGGTAADVAGLFRAHTIQKYSEQNPDINSFNKLNVEGLVSSLNNKNFRSLEITRFSPSHTFVGPKDRLFIGVNVSNTGTLPTKSTILNAVASISGSERTVLLGDVPGLKVGEVAALSFTLSIGELVGEGNGVNGQDILLSPALLGYETEPTDSIHVFISDSPVDKVNILSMWMSPMDFSDEAVDRKLHFIAKNIGSTSLEDVRANVYYVEAEHEGVPRAEKHVIDGNYLVGSIGPGATKEIVIPLAGIEFNDGPVSFISDLAIKGVTSKRFIQGYQTNAPKGRLLVQYDQVVHRNIADDAVQYLAANNIYIPDLHAAGSIYRGSRSSYNSWPMTLGLPIAVLTNTGYWTDGWLAKASSDFGGLNFTFVDGAHDADGVDIA